MKKDFFKVLTILLVSAVSVISCGGDDSSSSSTPLKDVTLLCKDAISLPGAEYKDMTIDNPFIASFKDEKLTGDHIGTTTAHAADGRSFNIIVNTKITTIKDMGLIWNASKSSFVSPLGTLTKQNDEISYYQDNTHKILYMYMFKNNKLASASILVPVIYASTLVDYLNERFALFTTDDDDIFAGGIDSYKVSTATTMMGVTVYNSNFYMVVIGPYSSSSSTRAISPQIESSFIKMYESLGY